MIYLDHAATSHPKPPGVLAAITDWYERLGVSADRGDSDRCLEARRGVEAVRGRLAALCGTPTARLAFVSGATEALNLSLRALLRDGDCVLTTAFEHSSVVRPLLALQQERGLHLEILPPSPTGGIDATAVADALAALRPRLFVFTHASNVTGAMFDAAALCDLARRHGALSLLDASQTAGLHDLALGADLVVASCHKSLLGPPGLGFLAARDGVELPPQKQGGTGSAVALDRHPTTWPQAFEAGTPNTPAILACLPALDWIDQQGRARLADRLLERIDQFDQLLADVDGIEQARRPDGPRLAITSFVSRRFDPAELGSVLASADIHVRTGFHCAPWLHPHLGTERSGTVRISPGPTISADDIAAAAAAVASA